MTIDQFIVPMMIAAAVAGSIMMLAHIVGAFLYDARFVQFMREYKKHPSARKYRARPLVTVVVSAHNDADHIMHTLDSILKGNYRKVEMLVVDLGSEDMSKAVVKGYIEQHPKQLIRLITRRDGEDGKQALRRAVKHYSNGALVLSIPAGGFVDANALTNAVRHFAYDETIDALNSNRYIESSASVIGLFERYFAMLSRRSDKFLSETSLLVTVRRMTMYRRAAYLSKRSRGHLKVHYAQDVTVGIPALASYRKLFGRSYRAYVHVLQGIYRQNRSWLKLGYICCSAIIALTGPLLIGYFLYIAVYLHEATLLLLCVAVLSAFLVIAINEEDRFNMWLKIVYIIGLPITFGLFYILSLARLLAVIGTPFHKHPADA